MLKQGSSAAIAPSHNLPSAGSGYAIDIVMECTRGLAAFWVFLFHIPEMVQKSAPYLYGLTQEGHRGVPVFFAVSGYCIFSAAQRSVTQASGHNSFLVRRLIRIYPTYWISLLAVLALPYLIELVAALKAGSVSWPDPGWMKHTPLDWLGVLSLTKELFDHAIGGGYGYTLINSVYWTLAIETQFYLVLYLAMLFKTRWLTILAVVSVLSVAAGVLQLFAWPGFFLQFWPAFLCGVLLRVAFTKGLTPHALFGPYEALVAAIALWAGGWLFWMVVSATGAISFTATAALASVALWCCAGIEHALKCRIVVLPEPVHRFGALLLLPFIWLGESSYSLYLLHGKLYLLPDMLVRQLVPNGHPLYLIACVVLTAVLCYGFYYYVERRFQRWRPVTSSKQCLTDAVAAMPKSRVT